MAALRPSRPIGTPRRPIALCHPQRMNFTSVMPMKTKIAFSYGSTKFTEAFQSNKCGLGLCRLDCGTKPGLAGRQADTIKQLVSRDGIAEVRRNSRTVFQVHRKLRVQAGDVGRIAGRKRGDALPKFVRDDDLRSCVGCSASAIQMEISGLDVASVRAEGEISVAAVNLPAEVTGT